MAWVKGLHNHSLAKVLLKKKNKQTNKKSRNTSSKTHKPKYKGKRPERQQQQMTKPSKMRQKVYKNTTEFILCWSTESF